MSAISDPRLHKDGHLVIRQAADLAQVLRHKRKIRRLELALPGLDARERAVAEARLATRIGACGCTEGALGLLMSLPVAVLVWQSVGLGPGLALVVAAALLGKGFGLIRARWALKVEITRIRSQVEG